MSEQNHECGACERVTDDLKPLNRVWVTSIWAAVGLVLSFMIWGLAFHAVTGRWMNQVLSQEWQALSATVFVATGLYGAAGSVLYIYLNVIGRTSYQYVSSEQWHAHENRPETLCGVFHDLNGRPVDQVWQIPRGGWFRRPRLLQSIRIEYSRWKKFRMRGDRIEMDAIFETVVMPVQVADRLVRKNRIVSNLMNDSDRLSERERTLEEVRERAMNLELRRRHLGQVMLATILEIRKTKPPAGRESKGSASAAHAAAMLEAGLAEYAKPSDEEVAEWKLKAPVVHGELAQVIVPRAMHAAFSQSSGSEDALAAAVKES